MKIRMLSGLVALLAWTSSVYAGGAIVAGGKTNTGIVIYFNRLDDVNRQIVRNELGKQLATGVLSVYLPITDEKGEYATCAEFGNLKAYQLSLQFLFEIAKRAEATDAIRSVGGCGPGI